jgi:hypothetical protein
MPHVLPLPAPREQANIGAVCSLAREYDIQGMMDGAEDWLVAAAERGAMLSFPTGQLSSGLITEVRVAADGTASSFRNGLGFGGQQAAVDQHVAAAVRFVRTLALARDFKLARFAAAANARVNALSEAHARLVLLTETALALSA